MTRVSCRLTAKKRDQLWNPTFGNRVWATFFSCIDFMKRVEMWHSPHMKLASPAGGIAKFLCIPLHKSRLHHTQGMRMPCHMPCLVQVHWKPWTCIRNRWTVGCAFTLMSGWPHTWNTQGFLWIWKLREFWAVSGKNFNKAVLVCHWNIYICVKQLLTGSLWSQWATTLPNKCQSKY